MRQLLSHHGHVSALQEDLIGDPMYTMTRPMVEWFGMGSRWEQEVRSQTIKVFERRFQVIVKQQVKFFSPPHSL